MSRQLVESILSNNMLEANDMVEAKLAEIRDCKVYEMKRRFASDMYEGFGGRPEDIRARPGYKGRASHVLGDPDKKPLPPLHGPDDSEKPKKSRKRKAAPKSAPAPEKETKTEPAPPPEKVERDWKTSAKLGIKRAKMRLNVLKHVPGELARQSKEIAVKKGKDIVSDPMAAAASGTKLAAKGVKKTAKGTVKAIKRAASAPVMTDLKHIGFRNL